MHTTLTERELRDLQRKAYIYDALVEDPGPQSLDTLIDWRRLVVGTQDAIRDRLTNRIARIDAHIENGGAR